ncbi:MAG: transposase, partial [Deinococcus sp.]
VFEKAWVYGSWMQVVVTLSPAGERVVIASDLSVLDTLRTYQKRWGIECSFSAMKSRGLGLEQTHMTAPDRLSRLFGLLCIVLAWMVRVGDAAQSLDPPTPDNRGRLASSKARTGWMLLSQAVRWRLDAFWIHLELLKTPFPAPGAGKSRSVSC